MRLGLFSQSNLGLVLKEGLVGEVLVTTGAVEGKPLRLATQRCEITSVLKPLARGGTLL